MSKMDKKSYEDFFKEVRKNSGPVKRPKLKKGNSWKFTLISFIGLIVAVGGLLYMDEVESFVKKIEISLLGPARAETKSPEAKKMNQEKDNEVNKVEKVEKTENVENITRKVFSNEEINHFSKLNERKRELDAREEELNRLDAELQVQKADIEKKMSELESTRRSIASVLNDRVKADNEKVDVLVQVYSTMKPQQAAKVFETMDEDLAVEILGRMKKKNSAEIMNLLKAEKTQIFSEKFAGYKKK